MIVTNDSDQGIRVINASPKYYCCFQNGQFEKRKRKHHQPIVIGLMNLYCVTQDIIRIIIFIIKVIIGCYNL
jgi:hypothetical protein